MEPANLFSILFLYFLNHSIATAPDVDNKIKIPEAITPEQYQRVDNLITNQDYIDHEVKDQLKRLGELHQSIGKLTDKGANSRPGSRYESILSDDSLIFNESTINSMEAPVIFLEPPLVLPKDQTKTDAEVENFLKKAGLEIESRDKSNDPYRITSINDAMTTEKVIKERIAKLRKTREAMFHRMRKLSLDIPGDPKTTAEFNNVKEGIGKLDGDLKTEIKKLTQVEHVKAALISKRGAGSEAKESEENLEEREEEMEKDADAEEKGEEDEEEEGDEDL